MSLGCHVDPEGLVARGLQRLAGRTGGAAAAPRREGDLRSFIGQETHAVAQRRRGGVGEEMVSKRPDGRVVGGGFGQLGAVDETPARSASSNARRRALTGSGSAAMPKDVRGGSASSMSEALTMGTSTSRVKTLRYQRLRPNRGASRRASTCGARPPDRTRGPAAGCSAARTRRSSTRHARGSPADPSRCNGPARVRGEARGDRHVRERLHLPLEEVGDVDAAGRQPHPAFGRHGPAGTQRRDRPPLTGRGTTPGRYWAGSRG